MLQTLSDRYSSFWKKPHACSFKCSRLLLSSGHSKISSESWNSSTARIHSILPSFLLVLSQGKIEVSGLLDFEMKLRLVEKYKLIEACKVVSSRQIKAFYCYFGYSIVKSLMKALHFY